MGVYRGRLMPIQFNSFFIKKLFISTKISSFFNSLVNILRILGRDQH